MSTKRKLQEIVTKLRWVDVLVGQYQSRINAIVRSDYETNVLLLAQAVRLHGDGSSQRVGTAAFSP